MPKPGIAISRRALAVAALATAPARAQSGWPDRPVRLIVGYPAGGPTDFAARLLQDPLALAWGQPIVIENRGGASQIIASEAVARSTPDGGTLFLAASSHTTNPALQGRLPYDTVADFTAITLIYGSPTVLFCHPELPHRSVGDVIAAARQAGSISAANSGIGSGGHLAAALFARRAGIRIDHVAYRGAAPALQDVVGGQVPITFSTLAGAIGLARGGRLRPLAVAAAARVEVLPGVPSLDELGLGIPDTAPWYGIIAPAGLPERIVRRIDADLQALLARPDFRQRLLDQGGVVLAEGPAVFTARIRREIDEWKTVVQELGIRVG